MKRSKVGLALAGGGPAGAIYEIGALKALDDVIIGRSFNEFDVYVGVSAGAFLAANLVNGLTTSQMVRAIVKNEPGEHPFVPETFLKPLAREYRKRLIKASNIFFNSLKNYIEDPWDSSVTTAITKLSKALPVAIFDNEPIRAYLERIYSIKNRTDDFRKLPKPLNVVAVELESGKEVCFGSPGYDHVPISKAVQASSALPGLYPPVEIDGRYFVDGVLKKTMHASVAFDAGCDLVISLNPIVPLNLHTGESVNIPHGYLIEMGLPAILSQTFRTLIYSRLKVGVASYKQRYPGRDILIFEPRKDDYRMFFTNIFTFSDRKNLCEHAYRSTLLQIRDKLETIEPVLKKHGLAIKHRLLHEIPNLWEQVGVALNSKVPLLGRLDRALDYLEDMIKKE